MCVSILIHFSHVRLNATLWIATCQSPLSMGLSRHEYWSIYLLSNLKVAPFTFHCVLFCVIWFFFLLSILVYAVLLGYNLHTINLLMLSVWFSEFYYIYGVVKSSPQSNSRTFSSPLKKPLISICYSKLFYFLCMCYLVLIFLKINRTKIKGELMVNLVDN